MTDLDTSAYTPAHQTEKEEDTQPVEPERTRFQIPLDQWQEPGLDKTLDKLQQQTLDGTELSEKIQEIKNLLNRYDYRKFLPVYTYKCRKCGDEFDTKQGAGVHRAMNPNCDSTEPWIQEHGSIEEQFEINEVSQQ